MKTTMRTLRDHLTAFGVFYGDQNPATRKRLVAEFNEMLDRLTEDDIFGTDGQLDPRGDQQEEA